MRHSLLVLILVVVPAVARAQTTRQGTIVAAQAAKAAALHPYSANPLEKAVTAFRRAAVESPSGPYPTIDSVYSGGGFTVGLGYRQFVGDRTVADMRGSYSLERYRGFEAGVTSPGHAGGVLDVGVVAGYREAPSMGYFGVGDQTLEDARASVRLQESRVAGTARFRPARILQLDGTLAYEDYSSGPGRGEFPPVDALYSPETAPGLGETLDYVHSTASAAIDWRPAAGYARRGGRYGVAYHAYSGQGSAGGFGQIDVDLVQHVPLLRENWVVSGRARLQSIVDGQERVPFYLLPALGGGSSLRGFNSFRFRDAHSLLMQGEFRWIPNRLALDMALFYDAGTVASTRGGLTKNGLVHDVGVGVRFHGPASTPLRVEIARGREGTRLVFGAKAAF